MNTLECIKARRSVRSFTDKKVEDDKLELIVSAGLEAPTAMNSRDIAITVLRGKSLAAVNEAMEKSIPAEMRGGFCTNGKFDFYRGGNALIVVSLGKKSVLPEQNTGCIMENMYLAATELGLGACWINQFYNFSNDEIVRLLKLDDGYKPYAGLSVGYVDKPPVPRERDGKVIFED